MCRLLLQFGPFTENIFLGTRGGPFLSLDSSPVRARCLLLSEGPQELWEDWGLGVVPITASRWGGLSPHSRQQRTRSSPVSHRHTYGGSMSAAATVSSFA